MNNINLKKSDKRIILVLIIYLIVMLAIFLPGYIAKKYNKIYIVTPMYKIGYENGKWGTMAGNNIYTNKQFDTYVNENYLGKYKIAIGNSILVLDENNTRVDYKGSVFAYSGTMKLELINDIETVDVVETDNELAKKTLKKAGIDQDAYYSIVYKVALDVNNDSKKETIFIINNQDSSTIDDNSLEGFRTNIPNKSGVNFSILFIASNDDIKIIDKYTAANEFQDFTIERYMDVKKDGKVDMIYYLGYPYGDYAKCIKLAYLAKNKIVYNSCK